MSLTTKALEDRKWVGLEALRDLLSMGNCPDPSIFYSPDSLEHFGETLEVADRFIAHVPEVVRGSEESCQEFRKCVSRLESRLREVATQLDLLASEVRARCDRIDFQVIHPEMSPNAADQEIARLLASSHTGYQGYGSLKVAAKLAVHTYGDGWIEASNGSNPAFAIAQKLRSIVIDTAPTGYSNKDMIWKRFKEAAKKSAR